MTTIDGINYTISSGEATITGPDDTTLTEITVPAIIEDGGNIYPVTTIGSNAFKDNTSITDIDFSGATNLVSVDFHAFMNCSQLSNIDFSGAINLTTIGNAAFIGVNQQEPVPSLLTSLDLSPLTNLQSIADNAFAYHNIESLDFSGLSNLFEIRAFAFRYNRNLTKVVFSGNSALTTDNKDDFRPFGDCDKLPTIDLSNTLIKDIGNNAFDTCTRLLTATLYLETIRLGNQAFSNTGLTEILIPYTVDTIVGYAFENFVTNFVLYWDKAYQSELDTYVNTAFSSSSTGLKVVYLETALGFLAPKLQEIQNNDYPSDRTIYYSPFQLDAPIISSNYSASSINVVGTIITFRLIFPQPFTAPLSEANDVSSYIVTEIGGATIISQPSTPQSQYNGYTFLFGDLDDSNTTITVHTTNNFPSSGTIIIEDEFISYTGTTSTEFTGCTRGAFGSTAAEHDSKTTVYEAVIITFTAEQGQSSFQFQVQATNPQGTSDLSNTSNILTIPDTPDKATEASKTYRTVTLEFTEPASSGAEITGYVVEANSGGVFSYPNVSVETAPGVSPARILIEGLTAETEYTFKIKAINNIGESSYSGATDPITTVTPLPPDVPELSSIDSAKATGINTATLEFTEPNDNGSDITVYDVKANGNDILQSNLSYTIGALPFIITIDGLTPNTSYMFTVQARNIKGGDGYSDNSNEITTDKAAPDKPENVEATASMLDSGVATLEFAEPNNNGAEITGYTVEATTGVTITTPSIIVETVSGVSPVIITVNGLDAETTYTFKVEASNSYGSSGYSDASNSITTIAANTFRIENIIYEIIFDPPGTDTGNVTIIGRYNVPDSWNAVVPATVYDINSNPYNVISFSDSAFINLTKLITITFTSSTTPFTFGASCFENCDGISEITIPENTTSIGERCFANCDGISEITIPENTTSIGASCFENCDGISEITIPENTTSIGERCFANCNGINTVNMVASSSITSLPDDMFFRCTNLETINNIPIAITSIGTSCFQGCIKLSAITIPENTTSIGASCFENCDGISEITIPENTTSIGERCFENCDGISEITIPENTTSIGERCFAYCGELTTLKFPVGIQIIETEIARNCANLEEVKMLGATKIKPGCFLECNKLTTVHAPKAEIFRDFCFKGCTSLEEIIMHDNVTTLGPSCFQDCTSLTKMLWKNQLSLTTIGTDIFLNVPNNMVVTYEYTVDPDIDPNSLSTASKQLQKNEYPGTTTYIYLSKPSPSIVNDIIATGPTTVSIIFTSPSYTGNSPITSYTATSTPGNITSTLYVNKSINDDINTTMNMERAIQLTIYITGLTPNTTYTFVMHTFNAYGRSDPSNIFNPVTTDPEPTPNPNPVPEPSLSMFNIRRNRASYGQFWFGKSIGFPGFLYKKNNGVGGRRSTKSAPGGNSNCNTYQNVNNSYTPGSGVGGSSIAVRRAKRKYATIQTMNQYL